MTLTLIGEHPLATDATGRLKSGIATIFPHAEALVTLPGIHITQRIEFTRWLDRRRASAGQPPLTPEESAAEWARAVDLLVTEGGIQIRPDPGNLELAFEADRLLQELDGFSKLNIRFMFVRDATVQQALRRRGEYWRIAPEPQSREEIADMIRRSRIAIFGDPIYYYNKFTGVRYLTFQDFAGLAQKDDEALRRHLAEIGAYGAQHNSRGHPELSFFGAGAEFAWPAPPDFPWAGLDSESLRARHAEIARAFAAALPPALRRDDPENDIWRKAMYSALANPPDETTTLEPAPGIPPEFFMQVRWLPGGRIEQGELILDPILLRAEEWRNDPRLNERSDPRVIGFLSNYTREFGNLEYVNIGFLLPSVRRHKREGGHRAYLAEVKHPGADPPVLRILRLQKWDIREHLDEGMDLLRAILEAQEYTEFILDRRLGCWQLGLPLCSRFETRRIAEIYQGANVHYRGARIWTTYFEREFIPGIATDKIPRERFADADFALEFARLLGETAAPNLVIGRATAAGEVIFDDGDEILVLDEAGAPLRIVAADHAGTFVSCDAPLERFAAGYALPVRRRADDLFDRDAFADTYARSLERRLLHMQQTYRRLRRAFDTMFQNSKQGEGTFADRWARVLSRLDRTDVPALVAAIRAQCDVPSAPTSAFPAPSSSV